MEKFTGTIHLIPITTQIQEAVRMTKDIRTVSMGTDSYIAELQPCPMCGKEAAIGKATLRRQDAAGEYREYTGYSVNCVWCGVNNRSIAEGYATPELAAEHWNRRCYGPSSELLDLRARIDAIGIEVLGGKYLDRVDEIKRFDATPSPESQGDIEMPAALRGKP